MQLEKMDTNLTLYKIGTYTFEQAAARSGVTHEEFAEAVKQHQIPIKQTE